MKENNTDTVQFQSDINSQILYEDNHIIVLNKKPSQIVQGDKTGDIPLADLLKSYLREKYHKPGDVFIGVVHRLDRPVSGVTLFARTSKALGRLNEMIRNRELTKIYWAVVKNSPPKEEGVLSDFLWRDEAKNKSFIVSSNRKGAQLAELSYRLISKSDHYYLLEVNLKTGRHHQIRAQLAHLGCPIKGDLKYGFNRSNPDGSIHLHAREIEFIHPVKKENIRVIAPLPEESCWRLFEP